MSLNEFNDNIQILLEDNFYFNEKGNHTLKGIGFSVWIEDFAKLENSREHGARIKVTDIGKHTTISVDPLWFDIRQPKTDGERENLNFSWREYERILKPFLQRRAIHEALANICYEPECSIKPPALVAALKIILQRWSRHAPDDYARDFNTIAQCVLDDDNILEPYNPTKLAELQAKHSKRSKKRQGR